MGRLKLRPFFSYFGGKWRSAPKYPTPIFDMIVEPFAGSAGYSLRYPEKKIVLLDKDPVIAGIWDYIIHVSEEEIARLPDLEAGQHVDSLHVCEEARNLIGFWCNAGTPQPRKTLASWALTATSQLFWGERVRARLIKQVPYIRHWEIFNIGYEECPDVEATWFVDPPYEDQGRHYTFSTIDFEHLASWCMSRSGQVTVCEAAGASWLPFVPFAEIKGTAGKHRKGSSSEVIWTNG